MIDTNIISEKELMNLEVLALSLSNGKRKDLISFSLVQNNEELEQVKRFRLDNYKGTYLASTIDPDGGDSKDNHSVLFAAWYGHSIIASVRLTRWPFDISSYISKKDLDKYLPLDWNRNTLEFSKLIVSKNNRFHNIGQVLSVYAAFLAHKCSDYTSYVGFSRIAVRNRALKFEFDNNELIFTIRNRNNGSYQLLSGVFERDYLKILKS